MLSSVSFKLVLFPECRVLKNPDFESKREVPRDIRNSKSPETRQVKERLVSTIEHMPIVGQDQNYLDQMNPAEFEIKDTTESNTSASYLDKLVSIGRDGQLRTSLYDKSYDFNFHITNCHFLSSNILSPPAYGVFIA